MSENSAAEIYPWLKSSWHNLLRQHEQDSMPHALLLTGPQGIGKAHFGFQLALFLLCSHPAGDRACGSCKSCCLMRSGTHPDLLRLSPEDEGKAIKVDQVRSINHFVGQTAQLGGYKIILLHPAEALNISAANALLKSLEEPNGRCLFVLLTDQPSRLPATIRSHCHQIALPLPSKEDALIWLRQHGSDPDSMPLLLNLANGAPLLALSYQESDYLSQRDTLIKGFMALQKGQASPLEIAQQWQSLDLLAILNWMNQYVIDLIKLCLVKDDQFLKNSDVKLFLSAMAEQVYANKLYLYRDRLVEAKRGLLSGNNPNKILLLEDLLIRWSRCISH